jgi:two-component system, cell cycle sensor histidine kinase and response regulator CckA
MSHIFEPFFTTKETDKGTGLGLATIYGLVKQHNGHIWVYSEVGKGSVFKIYFPIVDGVPVAEIGPDCALQLQPPSDGLLLLVEDDTCVRNLVAELLKSYGYNLMVAENPKQALAICRKHSIDLLLSDVIMPDFNGPELYSEMQKFAPDLKVLYMSGYTFNVIVHNGELDEGINFIQKPFTARELVDKIASVLPYEGGLSIPLKEVSESQAKHKDAGFSRKTSV